jgi:hypothetical protein
MTGERLADRDALPADELADLRGGDDARERDVRAGRALRERQHVRDDALRVDPEPVPAPAQARDDLVGDQEDVVLVADRTDPLEVVRGADVRAAGAGHRIGQDRRDRVGPLVPDDELQMVGRARPW